MAEKKINWLLVLQGWAMLWVVIGHAFLGKVGEGPEWENALFKFAYSFHMPLFMLVSGWLFYMTRIRLSFQNFGLTSVLANEDRADIKENKWTYWAIMKDKALRLLLPGLVFSIVALVLKLAFPGEMNRQVGLSWQEIAHSYLYPNDNPMRELWFIATLFWFFVLTPLWRMALNNEQAKWSVLVVLIVCHFLHSDIEFLCIDCVTKYAIWFYAGLVISKEKWAEKVVPSKTWWVLLIGLVIYFVGRLSDAFVVTVGAITFSFASAIIADKYCPKLFWSFRNYTYQIFLMGIFAQMFVKIMFKHISIPYVAAYILCILMGLYVPVLVSKLIEKINWKPLSLCVGLKPIKK